MKKVLVFEGWFAKDVGIAQLIYWNSLGFLVVEDGYISVEKGKKKGDWNHGCWPPQKVTIIVEIEEEK